MGKIKRLRRKLHISSKSNKVAPQPEDTLSAPQSSSELPLSLPTNNLFAGLNIDIDQLKTNLNDDTDSRSVRSSKSVKSKQRIIKPKKDKLKTRREMLLRKIDSLRQLKKDLKLREKSKKTPIIGDTNPLRDALPSLESLLKNRPNIRQTVTEPKKKRGIEKARKRKRQHAQGMKVFKDVMNNRDFQKDPLVAVTQHVQALVSQDKEKSTK